MTKTFTPEFVGLDPSLSFLLEEHSVGYSGKYPAFAIATKSTNGIVQSKNIVFYLKPISGTLYNPASQTCEDELRYAIKVSDAAGRVTFERPANPLNRKGNPTGLPKATFTYMDSETGSTKVVRQETPFFTFNCLAYDFMIGKTPAQIAAYCNVDNVTFKDASQLVAIAGTGINFTATADRIAKDCFVNPSAAKVWDACKITTTNVQTAVGEITSVFPRLSLEGNKLFNNTFINKVFWKDFPLMGVTNIGGKTTITTDSFTYRLKLLNGCQYANMTEAQAILGYGMLGQCGAYVDFYNDTTEQKADVWNLSQTSGEGRIDKATNTIYYDPSKPSFVIMEATLAPKSNPNAKVWSVDVCIDLRDGEQHSDVLTWFNDKM